MSQQDSNSKIGSTVKISGQHLDKFLCINEDLSKRNLFYHFQKLGRVPYPKGLWSCVYRFFKVFLDKTRKGRLQKSGSVFVCWLVCWCDWVY